MRVMVRFSKTGVGRYISHLDLIRLMQRVLRRAGVPLSYTQGFHPHPVMAFASALGVGIESLSEYMDITLTEDVDPQTCLDKVNRVMPAHMRVLGIKPLSPAVKGLMGLVTAASYEIALPVPEEELADRCRKVMDASTWAATVVKKDGSREVDLRAGLHRLEMKNGRIDLLADAGSRRNLNPVWFADALWPAPERKTGQTARIIRTDLYTGNEGEWTSLWDMEA